MNIELLYFIVTTLIFLFLSVAWKTSSPFNTFMKCLLVTLFIAGLFLTLQSLGVVVVGA